MVLNVFLESDVTEFEFNSFNRLSVKAVLITLANGSKQYVDNGIIKDVATGIEISLADIFES